MKTYWKSIIDGYIHAIGEGTSENPITAEEYDTILEAIHSRPTPPDGYDYHLREDLTWEQYELPVVEEDPDPELSDSEAMAIILGGDTDA